MAEPELSVVIPAYNEAEAIGRTLEAVRRYLDRAGCAHEIVVADDGSQDATPALVRAAAAADPRIRLLAAGHAGKGAAVKRGMLAARGAYRLFMDADSSTSVDAWAVVGPWLRDGYDVVIGSRKMSGARVTVRQPWLRERMGQTFTWLSNRVLSARVSDITCGFKGFTAGAAQRIFSLQRMDGWGFDAEILFIARRQRCRIKEVPVVWADDASTKVRLARDAVRSLAELIQIRLGAWRGRYPRAAAPGANGP